MVKRYGFIGNLLIGLIVILFVSASVAGIKTYAVGPGSRPNAPSGSESSANSAQASNSSSSSRGGLGRLIEPNEVVHIEIEKDVSGADTSGVLIGSRVYYLNDEVFGGKVIKLTDDKVTIKFKDHTKSYRVGDRVEEGKEKSSGKPK